MKINKVVLVIMFVTGLITVSSVTAVSAQWEPVTGDIRNDYSTFRSYWRDGVPGANPILTLPVN